MNERSLAVRLMIAQSTLFAAETMIVHQIGGRISILQLAAIRAAAGIALALVLARRMGFAVLRARQFSLQLLRGAVAAGYLWVMMYSYACLPIADATAISHTQAAYIAVFAVLILGETVSPARWTAAMTGIVGALLVAKPSFAAWHSAYLVALAGTALNGLSFVLNRYLQRQDSEATTMLYTSLVPALAYAPAAALAGAPPVETLPWLSLLLILGPVGVFCGIVAVRHASASVLGPYTLLRLVIAIVAGITLFGEMPDLWSAIGAVVILGGCLLSSGLPSVLRAKRMPRVVAA